MEKTRAALNSLSLLVLLANLMVTKMSSENLLKENVFSQLSRLEAIATELSAEISQSLIPAANEFDKI